MNQSQPTVANSERTCTCKGGNFCCIRCTVILRHIEGKKVHLIHRKVWYCNKIRSPGSICFSTRVNISGFAVYDVNVETVLAEFQMEVTYIHIHTYMCVCMTKVKAVGKDFLKILL
jgi:hypothetical protein